MSLITTIALLLGFTLTDNGHSTSHECTAGERVEVSGNKNRLDLTGECGTVSVSGNENQVTVDTVAEIVTQGNKNSVRWYKGAGDKAPKVSNSGTGNEIKKRL